MLQETSAFDKMLNSKTSRKFLKGLKPVLKIPDKIASAEEGSNLCYEKLWNSFTTSDSKEFQASADDLLEVLHLLHEDYRLNIFKHKLLNEGILGEFLFRFCLKIGPKRLNYSDFYIKEYPFLSTKFSKEIDEYKTQFQTELDQAKELMVENRHDDNFIVPEIFLNIATVPSIYSWVEAKLNPDQANYDGDYLCFFETSRKVGRLFDIFTQDQEITKSQIHPLLHVPRRDADMELEINNFLLNTALFGIAEDQQELIYETRGDNLLKKIVFCLKEERMGRDTIKKLPLGISLPIQEVLSHEYFQTIYVRSSENEKKAIEEWPKEIFKLVEREDLYYNLQELKKTKNFTEEFDSEFQFSRISSLNINKALSKRKSNMLKLGRQESTTFANPKSSVLTDRNSIKPKQSLIQNTGDSETQEYMNLIDKEFQRLGLKNNQMTNMVGKVSEGNFISYRFSSDLRYMEVSLMLDSSIPFKLRIDNIEGIEQMATDKLEETKQRMHLDCITRQFAKCVGRGALKLGTIHTVPTERLKIPEICMTALLPPSNKKMGLKEGVNPIAGWAEFHNGVATGLQLATEFDPFSNQIKNWILYHRPPTAKDEFGGFLMSMGFHGYLK